MKKLLWILLLLFPLSLSAAPLTKLVFTPPTVDVDGNPVTLGGVKLYCSLAPMNGSVSGAREVELTGVTPGIRMEYLLADMPCGGNGDHYFTASSFTVDGIMSELSDEIGPFNLVNGIVPDPLARPAKITDLGVE